MLLTMLSPYFQDIGVFAAGTTPTASGSKNDKKPEIPSGSVDFPDHIVSAVEPPEGTIVNVFDYWLTGQNDSDVTDPANRANLGINRYSEMKFWETAKSDLKFATTGSPDSLPAGTTCNLNKWALGAYLPGIVRSELVNGYPVLSDVYSNESDKATGGTSLAYLFDPDLTNIDGRAVYTDAKSLLRYDSAKKRYYYDSEQNYAARYPDYLGSGTNQFFLYDAPIESAYINHQHT